jgi:hypothetical protein
VQIEKNPMKTKGARVTMELSIAGRFLVLTRRTARAPASASACPTASASGCASSSSSSSATTAA